MKKVAIVGIVGLPAEYGGFETLAQYLVDLKHNKDIKYRVYCSKKVGVTYLDTELYYVPLKANGIQSILYDIYSLFRSINFDTILILGVSGCIILPVIRLISRAKIIINVDGIEHRRAKWGKFSSWFLKISEKVAVKYAHIVVSDNKGVASYIMDEYNINSSVIAYGGDQTSKMNLQESLKTELGIPSDYAFKVCRIEPENNIELVLNAFANSRSEQVLILVGNWNKSEYAKNLREKFKFYSNLILLDPIYDLNKLDQLRSNATYYIHGHSAGGTNPSLVEAMNLGLPIISFDVVFNRETTENKAIYFKSKEELINVIDNLNYKELSTNGENMLIIAKNKYKWDKIVSLYEALY